MTPEEFEEITKPFRERLIKICALLGDAELESDDAGDRWISFNKGELAQAEIRARYLDSIPVWEIEIRSTVLRGIVYRVNVERVNDQCCNNCLHKKSQHNYDDKQGCGGIADYERETNSYIRCHCFDFMPQELEE